MTLTDTLRLPASLIQADFGPLVRIDLEPRLVVFAFCLISDREYAPGPPQESSHVCWWW